MISFFLNILFVICLIGRKGWRVAGLCTGITDCGISVICLDDKTMLQVLKIYAT